MLVNDDKLVTFHLHTKMYMQTMTANICDFGANTVPNWYDVIYKDYNAKDKNTLWIMLYLKYPMDCHVHGTGFAWSIDWLIDWFTYLFIFEYDSFIFMFIFLHSFVGAHSCT